MPGFGFYKGMEAESRGGGEWRSCGFLGGAVCRKRKAAGDPGVGSGGEGLGVGGRKARAASTPPIYVTPSSISRQRAGLGLKNVAARRS